MTSGHDIAMALRAAYWAMHRQANALLAQFGVTADQYVLLCLLAEEDQVTQQELVRRASSDANTVRAMLVLLEERGLVLRRPHPTDRRARSVALTARGRRTHQRLWERSATFRDRLSAAAAGRRGASALVEDLLRIAQSMTPGDRQERTSANGRHRA